MRSSCLHNGDFSIGKTSSLYQNGPLIYVFLQQEINLCLFHWQESYDILLTFRRDYSYRKTSNISCTLLGNKIIDNSDVDGASPVGAAPTTSSFST